MFSKKHSTLFLLFGLLIFCSAMHLAKCDVEVPLVTEVDIGLRQAFTAMLEAEEIGANVRELRVQLDEAGELLEKAEAAYHQGDVAEAEKNASASLLIAENVTQNAVTLKDLVAGTAQSMLWQTLMYSSIGVLGFIVTLFLLWNGFSHFYSKQLNQRRTQTRSRVDLENYKIVFIAAGLIGIILLASPVFSILFPFSYGEKFSELWILDSEHTTENYPFYVSADEEFLVHLGVSNHLKSSAYYIVSVKFSSQNEFLPDVTTGLPSPLPTLYKYRVFLDEGGVWEVPLTFSFPQVIFFDNQSRVEQLMINAVEFQIDAPSVRSSENAGNYYQLFFELWLYTPVSDEMVFHNRFAVLWLSMVP